MLTLIEQLNETFSGSPWYGEAVWPAISKLSAADFNKKTPSGKSVGHIIEHMLAWRKFVLAHLLDDSDFQIEINSDQDWNFKQEYRQAFTQHLIEQMAENQKSLLSAIERFPTDKLATTVPGKKYTFLTLIMGIRDHDIYHLGQINLLKNTW